MTLFECTTRAHGGSWIDKLWCRLPGKPASTKLENRSQLDFWWRLFRCDNISRIYLYWRVNNNNDNNDDIVFEICSIMGMLCNHFSLSFKTSFFYRPYWELSSQKFTKQKMQDVNLVFSMFGLALPQLLFVTWINFTVIRPFIQFGESTRYNLYYPVPGPIKWSRCLVEYKGPEIQGSYDIFRRLYSYLLVGETTC